ncbi:MAG TPA: hypothetical protein VI382_01475, partial [Candidatus Manganitrophaceae bacterium]|nr:hypothetical protein [Candidatus Manganitrophaceae bacterium]
WTISLRSPNVSSIRFWFWCGIRTNDLMRDGVRIPQILKNEGMGSETKKKLKGTIRAIRGMK